MGSRKKDIKIAITKDGKDLCRLIFSEDQLRKYDVKICLLGQKFAIHYYRHFAYRPIILSNLDSEEKDITYHQGKEDYPVLIHTVRKNSEPGESPYDTVLKKGLLAPSTDYLFPLPLFKLEVSQSAIDKARPFHQKKGESVIDLHENNVAEFFLSRAHFDEENFAKRYGPIAFVASTHSLEYFGTFANETALQKIENYMPRGKSVRTAGTGVSTHGINLFASLYNDPFLRNDKESIVTFIQNDLAEAILLTTLFYPDSKGAKIGAPLKSQLSPLPGQLLPDSTAALTIQNSPLTLEEKETLYLKGLKAIPTLYHALDESEKELREESRLLFVKAKTFLLPFFHEQRLIFQRIQSSPTVDDVDLWLLNLQYNLDGLHLLFAKEEKCSNALLFRWVIHDRNLAKENLQPTPQTEEGSASAQIVDPRRNYLDHYWLGYDDFFDVDLFWNDFNQYFEKDQKKEPLIMVRRGHFFSEDYNKDIANKIKERGYVIDPLNPLIITDAFLKAKMVENNNLLQRVLERIESHQ